MPIPGPLDVTIEIQFDGTNWIDVSTDALAEDVISYSAWRGSSGQSANPGSLSFTLYNDDGRYSPKYESGVYYRDDGWLGCLVRISIESVSWFYGKISELRPRWTMLGVCRLSVSATGLWGQVAGSNLSGSSLYRSCIAVDPVAYYMLTDGADASDCASVVAGQDAMTIAGTVSLSSVQGPDGASANLPQLAASSAAEALTVTLDSENPTGQEWSIDFLYRGKEASAGQTYTSTIIAVETQAEDIVVKSTVTAGVELVTIVHTAKYYGGASATVNSGNFVLTNDSWRAVRMTCSMQGTTSVVALYVDDVPIMHAFMETTTAGSIEGVTIWSPTTTYVSSRSIGHLLIRSGIATFAYYDASLGYAGEYAATRVIRVCDEVGLTCTASGAPSNRLGPQPQESIVTILRDVEKADMGRVLELSDGSLKYEVTSDRYGAGVTIALTADQLLSSPEPSEGIGDRVGEVIASRSNGGTRRAVNAEVLAKYGVSVSDTYNVYTDGQLTSIAAFELGRLGAETYRLITLPVSMYSEPNVAAGLLATWLAARAAPPIRVTVSGIPYWSDVDVFVDGFEERIGPTSYELTLHCSSAKNYQVMEIEGDDRPFRLGPTQVLTLPITDSATTAIAQTTDGPPPALSASYADDYPVELKVGSELVSCTACAASGTLSHVGVGASDSDDYAAVTPGLPTGWAAGDLLVCLAVVRTETASPVRPDGWDELVNLGNVVLYGRIAQTGDVGPTIMPANGATGCSVSAQVAAFRGPVTTTVIGYEYSENASAQDIAVPAYAHPILAYDGPEILLQVGWKQDDWLSAATASPWTEIGETATTLGDDQGVVWGYRLVSTHTDAVAYGYVITGGGAAVSTGLVVALRADARSLTITRSVNDVVAAHAAGDAVTASPNWGSIAL